MRFFKQFVYFIIVVFLFYSLTHNFSNYIKNIEYYNKNKENYQKEQKNNITLKTQLRKQQAPSEIEKTIRNQLNLLKPNEVSLIISLPTPTPIIPTPSPVPNYLQWLRIFSGSN
ncbi:hypothetical protein AUK04_02145 [Candidatus Roizmanbacteria bacterium CG2_30_33_16]|uniref:Cell division protein FtsL n=5 Tax=Candidatus Roizmaniibacteriota TaxID=1752723 RepID=A0A2M7E500_9BACT|nr:hypothetical protein [Candidatus Roizmanbacteria bacterium]OIP84626.1 MAG: hypothetical protein AUK04_02145 [Candidatus Roizmanbacteria bacterium CG2_30_33_16]PIP64226.1 MAG: hypothetical protein COW96_03745 [Candidatus Roizmanbacteria bacterium CG22_combo_CG10-13_8_21_14_all_33_16]PIV62794.1 MAG: hypothetical protein COS12_01045 [Candidatus Roizmanbacteria bacterium CG01_land_8_20_14_3_00_33_9]PIX73601.1 MAG: hypothetical protein COZ39_02135 [Candidatus Roizmanbacteria bacterium CG_4_10_14_